MQQRSGGALSHCSLVNHTPNGAKGYWASSSRQHLRLSEPFRAAIAASTRFIISFTFIVSSVFLARPLFYASIFKDPVIVMLSPKGT
jgi:hypothetical protein